MTPGMPGPLLRLKTGTESATPSVNGIIARNLVRLSALLLDEKYGTLARQTCNSFVVEIMQHPFLFVGLLDAVVGLELGVRIVTGVLCTAGISRSATSPAEKSLDELISARDQLINKVRGEAGLATSTSAAAVALVDVRLSHSGDFVGNQSFWLKTRNQMYRELQPSGIEKNYLFVCEAGRCRTVYV